MGMMKTYGIEAPQIIKSGTKVHLAYMIPLPATLNLKDAIRRMNESIARANYGFEATLRPTVDECDQKPSVNAAHLYVTVLDRDRDDPIRMHGLSYGLALRIRGDLEAR